MRKLQMYVFLLLLGGVFMVGLGLAMSIHLEAQSGNPTVTEASGTCQGGVIFNNVCICPPGQGLYSWGCAEGPGDGSSTIVQIYTPVPTPDYPVPPPPDGGFGGFLQPMRGSTFYTSNDYQISNDTNQLTVRLTEGENVVIPHFVFTSAAELLPLRENTPIFIRDNVALHMLTTGEFQINIGPDAAGNVRVIIFDGLDAEYVYGYTFNVHNIDD